MKSWHDLRDLCESLREEATTDELLVLQFAGLRVLVHSRSSVLLKRLEGYFAPFLIARTPAGNAETVRLFVVEKQPPKLDLPFERWPREPGKERLKEEVATIEGYRVVRKVRTGMQFVCTDREHYAFGPCLKNLNQVINFVGSRFMTHYMQRGWQLCHAAGIAREGAGLAIAGVSGGGKSTLALHLMASGLDYVSNDRVLMRATSDSVKMLGVPKLPRINPGTAMHNHSLTGILPMERLEELRQLDSDELWNLEEKYDVDIDECFGEGRMRMHADLRGVVILNWRRHSIESAQLRQVSLSQRPDLLRALTKAAGPFYQPGGLGPANGLTVENRAYLDVLERLPVFEMTGGVDFVTAVGQCTHLLLEGASIRA
jgi:HprK-related kinase B